MNAPSTELTPATPRDLIADSHPAVRRLAAYCSLPTALIPAALQIKPKMSPAEIEKIKVDQLLWARTSHALGLDIIEAVKHVTVIAGAPVLSAELGRRKALERGAELVLVESSSARAVVRGRRAGSTEWTTATFTRKDAERAGYFDVRYVRWQKDESGNSRPDEWFAVQFDFERDELVRADPANRPKWASDRDKKWKENWYRQTPAMLVARASTVVTRIIDPVPTLGAEGLALPIVYSVSDSIDAGEHLVDVAPAVDPIPLGEPEILDAELVDDTPADPALDEFVADWRAACETNDVTPSQSAAVLTKATGGAASKAAGVPAELRADALHALQLFVEQMGGEAA